LQALHVLVTFAEAPFANPANVMLICSKILENLQNPATPVCTRAAIALQHMGKHHGLGLLLRVRPSTRGLLFSPN
jgi:hypothetical protein